ncbi:MAG: ankyrin repeat domain-containing protein [Akkermansia sp.]|nr:ankyrin repeat domain-containing protein [Akkermansia sp.]
MNEETIQSEFFAAICHNEADTVQKLLAEGAGANTTFRHGLTPLMVAARAGAHAVLPVLLAGGAQVNARDDLWGRTAFHWLCTHGLVSHYHRESHTESARALLAAGADAFAPDNTSTTPLLMAIRREMRNVIKLIHAHSPIPNGKGKKLLIPWLDVAYLRRSYNLNCYSDKQIHRYYIAPPPPPEPGTTLRRSRPLPYNAEWAEKANLSAVDKRGHTALHHAAAMGLYEVACVLIARGAEVNATARSGATPLMIAARSGHWRVGHLLLAHGAATELRDCHGRNAADYARRAGNHRLIL